MCMCMGVVIVLFRVPPSTMPQKVYLGMAATYVGGMLTSYWALDFITFPTIVLMKSCKFLAGTSVATLWVFRMPLEEEHVPLCVCVCSYVYMCLCVSSWAYAHVRLKRAYGSTVLVMGSVVYRKRYSVQMYLCAAAITLGICVFSLAVRTATGEVQAVRPGCFSVLYGCPALIRSSIPGSGSAASP